MRCILVLALLLTSVAAYPASAQLLEVLAGAKFCRTLKDDSERLKCFDELFAGKSSERKSETEIAWSVTEDKSPIDDSPQVQAQLRTRKGSEKAELILRCREKKTEAIFFPSDYLGSGQSIKVLVRIADSKPAETLWNPSSDGRAAFAPSAVQFIRALPDNGKLFIRATGYRGTSADGEFDLGAVSEIREKIAQACNWSAPAAKQSREPNR
jgi:Type VI secretion system VasI, EvfG, VC_A0118